MPNIGETKLEAVSGEYRDESLIRKVDEFNQDYILKEEGSIINWFEITSPAGRFSLNNTIGSIMETLRGKILLLFFVKKIMKSRKQNQQNKEVDQSSPANAMKMNKDMIEIVKSFIITRISNMIGMLGVTLAKEDLLKLNKKLNKIRIPKKKNK